MGEILTVFLFSWGNARAVVLFGSTWQTLQEATPRIKLEDLYNFSQHSPSRGEASSPPFDLEKQNSWASGRLHTPTSTSTACRPALTASAEHRCSMLSAACPQWTLSRMLCSSTGFWFAFKSSSCLSMLQQPSYTVTNTQVIVTALC